MIGRAVLLGGVIAATGSAAGALEMTTARYLCERGVEVPVTYVNGTDGSVAILDVEGRQVSLVSEPAGSGSRFGWPSGGSSYLWVTKGAEAILLWRDAVANDETVVLSACRQVP